MTPKQRKYMAAVVARHSPGDELRKLWADLDAYAAQLEDERDALRAFVGALLERGHLDGAETIMAFALLPPKPPESER